MGTTSGATSWDNIQLGVKDTERKIGQKDYNAAMIQARQTLEFMVKQLAERACIVDGGDLKDMIDTLYQNQWISKTTCEHYHKIRLIGTKAAQEGDTNAYNANQAYHMLSQEVYTFANDYSNARKGTRVKPTSRSSQSGRASGSSGKSASSTGRSYSGNTRSRKRQGNRNLSFTSYDLLKLLIPVLCIILLFCVVKLFKPGRDANETTPAQVATEAMQETPPTETQGTQEVPAVVYRTTTTLNVRPEPSTDTDRIGQLPEGTAVEYVRAHDADWAVILYQGQEAYVASQYLTTE